MEEAKFAKRNSISIWAVISLFEETEKYGYRDSGHHTILPLPESCKSRTETEEVSRLPIIHCNQLELIAQLWSFSSTNKFTSFPDKYGWAGEFKLQMKKYLPVMSSHTFYLDFRMPA